VVNRLRQWTHTQWAGILIGGLVVGSGMVLVFYADDVTSFMVGGLMIVLGLVGGMRMAEWLQ